MTHLLLFFVVVILLSTGSGGHVAHLHSSLLILHNLLLSILFVLADDFLLLVPFLSPIPSSLPSSACFVRKQLRVLFFLLVDFLLGALGCLERGKEIERERK
jgi:hypothetical protein